MTVEENRRLPGRVQPVAIDHGIARRLDQPHVLHAGGPQRVGGPLGRAADVGACSGSALMLGIARYCFSSST